MEGFNKLFFFGILAMALVCTGTAYADSPTDQLKLSIDQILDVLRDPELKAEDKKEARREILRQIARQRFDYRKMSERSLGKYVKGKTEAEMEAFTALFTTLVEDSYMGKIESYTDEDVVFLKERIKKKKQRQYAKINTKIVTETVEIPIDYMMYKSGTAPWMVYDMIIEGVSMVSNYRSQFGDILERDSFATLIQKLKDKKD
ncbi:MAG: ABC transporter substrate-binding protein [Desulfobacter sp.]|nr:ABC transporter substrate-binding protein [Desulfobacter sp.]WDP85812.1 MAG: ABC transporter substrate-binding protein [Desulfobacter sp.]